MSRPLDSGITNFNAIGSSNNGQNKPAMPLNNSGRGSLVPAYPSCGTVSLENENYNFGTVAGLSVAVAATDTATKLGWDFIDDTMLKPSTWKPKWKNFKPDWKKVGTEGLVVGAVGLVVLGLLEAWRSSSAKHNNQTILKSFQASHPQANANQGKAI